MDIEAPPSNSKSPEGILARAITWVETRLGPLIKEEPFKVAIYLALITFLLERWPAEPQLVMLCAFALVVRRMAFSWPYWLLITAIYLATHGMFWYRANNHWWLFFYWSLAIALCLYSNKPELSLAKSARWMIALIFVLSSFWKATSPEFLNGVFVEYALLADIRLTPISLVLGLDGNTLATNREILENLMYAADTSGGAQLTTNSAIPIAAILLSWGMFIPQVAVAVVFLLPDRFATTFWRHTVMLVFIYTTYPLAQVSGFGLLLTGMAISQLKAKDRPIYMILYLAGFFMIFMSKNPGVRGILHHLGFL